MMSGFSKSLWSLSLTSLAQSTWTRPLRRTQRNKQERGPQGLGREVYGGGDSLGPSCYPIRFPHFLLYLGEGGKHTFSLA